MANLNIGAALATVNTLASLPVDKGTIYATLSAPTNLSLAAAMYQGQVMNVVINPTATFIQTVPTTGGYSTTFGDTLPLGKGLRMVLVITCIGSGQYLLSYDSNPGAKANGYDYVDLGLPSGLLWATCNVGASQPHEYGKYFQWGATEGYYSGTTAANHSDWATCPWGSGTPTMTQLDAAHDAARANMGGAWRMPTSAETKELVDYTTSGWTTVSGVNVMRLTSKSNSNNSIFFPAAGHYYSGLLRNSGGAGFVWSSSLYPSGTNYAYSLNLSTSGVYPNDTPYRFAGFSVRGVIS